MIANIANKVARERILTLPEKLRDYMRGKDFSTGRLRAGVERIVQDLATTSAPPGGPALDNSTPATTVSKRRVTPQAIPSTLHQPRAVTVEDTTAPVEKVECPKCNGKGKYKFLKIFRRKCKICGGTGEVDDDTRRRLASAALMARLVKYESQHGCPTR